VKKLSLASLQTEKTKNKEPNSKQSAKGKPKSVKDKNTSANTFYCCHKGHIANNDLLDVDTKPSSFNSLESNKDKVEEVAAYS
jgi:hypothetical protein